MESFSKDEDKEYQETSQDARGTVKEQGNLEAHEMLMITVTIQCKSCQLRDSRTHLMLVGTSSSSWSK